MESQFDPIDEAFDALKSQRAVFSDSFSTSLEDRLMQEQRKQKRSGTRLMLWVALAIVAMLGSGVASYAMTDGWNLWPWSVSIDEQGTVTNSQGDVIGGTVENDDGTSTTFIQMGQGHIEVQSNENLKGKSLNFVVEP